MTATAAEPVEATWPSPTFLKDAQRLRFELEAAIRNEQTLAERVAAIQDAAFRKSIPVALLAGGPDELKKLSAARDAAAVAVNDKRAELRQFLAASRAEFFAIRNRAEEQLRAGISAQLSRIQEAAKELCAAFSDSLGTEDECVRQEKLIRLWNRQVKKFSRTIPSINAAGIPSVAGIDPAESLRSRVHGFFLQDPNVRVLCGDFLARTAQQRERATAFEERKLDEEERTRNPVSTVAPFSD